MNDPSIDDPHTELSKPNSLPREPAAPLVLQLGQAGATTAQTFSFNVMWQCLLHRLPVAIPLGLVLAALAGAAVKYFTEEKFRSLATLRIVDKQPYLAFPTQESSADFAQTQIELLKGPYIIGRAIESEGLAQLPELRKISGKEDSVLWISQRLKAVRTGKSEIYEVSMTTTRPESARKIVEAIVDTYMQFQTDDSEMRRQVMLEVLDEELIRYDDKIELARRKLRGLAKETGGDDGVVMDVPGYGGRTARTIGRVTQRSTLQDKLVDAEVEVEIARARVAALADEVKLAEGAPGAAGPDAGGPQVFITESQIEARIERDPTIVSLRKELQKQEDKSGRLSKTSALYARVEEEISALKAGLEAKKAELKPAILRDAEQQLASGRRDDLIAAQADLHKKLQAEKLLRARTETERGAQSQHGDKSLELQFARDELDKDEDIRRHIADRKVHLTTESRAPGQVQKIQKATLPEFPEGPSVVKKVAMVSAAAFLSPFLLLVGWNLAHRRIFQREQLERELDVKVIKFVSEVTALPTRPRLRKPGDDRAYQLQSHLFEESIESLRATLAIDARLHDMQVFVIASAVSGEGKSNLSAQLAMSWSQSMPGKVLVVDADLRSPSMHELFETRPDPGLAEVMRGECTVENATIMDWGDRLYVLPAGNSQSSSPAKLFSAHRFREVLAELRQHYDKIIIDVPPVLCASEVLLIAKEADAVLMCALHAYSHSGQVKYAYDRLVGCGVNVIGAVLNGTPAHRYSSTYRGYFPA
ncbi:MAG: AAA family ATPase [Planctomycetia bacterium]|nr:AAA family ATPase [Planctomycetia bacterium]